MSRRDQDIYSLSDVGFWLASWLYTVQRTQHPINGYMYVSEALERLYVCEV